MHFDTFHNHKWARNLFHGRELIKAGNYHVFYFGEDLPDNDVYPGMRVMAAYWISVEHEMKMRLNTLLAGAKHPEWRKDAELIKQRDLFFERFLQDMRQLILEKDITDIARFNTLVKENLDLRASWREDMRAWQAQSQAALEKGDLPNDLIESWIDSCLRSIANYNLYLIWGGVICAALLRRESEDALKATIDATAQDFMWDISREFYVNVMPSVGFEDLGDVMELGMRGMFSDQYYETGEERQEGENTIKQSLLKNCELAGVFRRVAEWNNLPSLSLGYGICRYCEAHGEATMQITIPPMYSPSYKRLQSIGMEDKTCIFKLTLTPADDMERLMRVQQKVFGGEE
jgi:hypothetical protein